MKEAASIEIADFIRSKSRAGELVASEDLEHKFPDSTVILPPSSPADSGSGILPACEPFRPPSVMSGQDDIKEVLDDSGKRFFFSERFMTSSYANLTVPGSEPLRVMAEVIREHSRIYPRPVPINLFQCSPFNFAADIIALALKEIIQQAQYRDLAQITTSAGNVFFYSTDYLDRDYAAMLAEWADVGQVENP